MNAYWQNVFDHRHHHHHKRPPQVYPLPVPMMPPASPFGYGYPYGYVRPLAPVQPLAGYPIRPVTPRRRPVVRRPIEPPNSDPSASSRVGNSSGAGFVAGSACGGGGGGG